MWEMRLAAQCCVRTNRARACARVECGEGGCAPVRAADVAGTQPTKTPSELASMDAKAL